MNPRLPIASAAACALSLALLGCASDEEPTAGETKGNMFTGNFEFDPEQGKMVATGGNRFRTGEYDARREGDFRTGDFNSGNYKTKAFDGREEFEAEPFATEAYRTSSSPFQGKAARAAGQKARLGGRRVDTPQVPVNPYREASKIMDSGSYRDAEASQERGDHARDNIINRDGDDGDDMKVDDIRRLLNKG